MSDGAPNRKEVLLAEMLGTLGFGSLSPIETRIAGLAKMLMQEMIVQVRFDPISQTMKPLTAQIVSEGARLSMVAAIEMDEQLRILRQGLKSLSNA